MVIILFNTGLQKTIFCAYSFGKLVFCLSAPIVITACSEFDVLFKNFCNICIIIICIVGVTCFRSHLSLHLRTILTGKNHRAIKLQRLRKVRIWAFGSLVHQIKSWQDVFKLTQNLQKNKAVTGRTPFFLISPFCSHHFICLNIGFWYGSYVWKWCVFNLSAFN